MLHDPTQSLFVGAIPMGFATIVNGIVFFCVPRFGSPAVEAAWVTFWIDTGLSLVSGWLVRLLTVRPLFLGSPEIGGVTVFAQALCQTRQPC